ncbi:sunset domain-containing protein [Paenarthrobacter nitroguajacolicus]|uniref:sunset domain-containing protein n=1 Tax=Paenarthrobacter nitroguajacolicus TaxID=211146 RepID=UPI00248B9482|nr:hypothetical protein [Paenarthrobacter nitroguajacolicus]MDI2034045.1 hypothetical protein [Paenarthrobacter nitroguajacolicus]
MDWLIWVIVIVLVVAIVWWLMSRNKAANSAGGQAPAAMEPANTGSVPDPGAVTAGVAGLAGVSNLGKAAAEGSGPTGDEPVRVEPPMDEPARDEPVRDENPAPVEPAVAEPANPEVAPTPGLTVEEPVIAAPVVEEPVVAEPVVDTDAKLHSADAGDVDDWEAAPAAEVTADDVTRADDAADKAEWESSWTDAAGTPVHHHEYTDPHSPTLPGAESAAAESAAAEEPAASGHLAAEEPYGTGSSSTPRDGHPVKAIAATMTYHDEDAADYDDVEADVWFESAAHAEAAGFRPPRRSRH